MARSTTQRTTGAENKKSKGIGSKGTRRCPDALKGPIGHPNQSLLKPVSAKQAKKPISLADEIKAGRMPADWDSQLTSMFEEGASNAEVVAKICQWRKCDCRDLVACWIEDEPEFRRVIMLGRQVCEGWWLKEGRDGLRLGSHFNSSLYQFCMVSRFGNVSERINATVDIGTELLNLMEKNDGATRSIPVKASA
jgi:hypothetical protein